MVREKILESLASVRPYLQIDGGDVELISVTADGIVTVRFLGACVGCPMSIMTLRAGVERALMRDIPEVRRVEAISV